MNEPGISSTAQPAVLRLVPDARFTWAASAGSALACLIGLVSDDAPSRLLFAVAAIVLGVYAACDRLFSPRVEAGPDGLVIRSPLTRATLTWQQVEHVRADVSLHRGLRSTTLEIDAGELLIVLSRRSIGADPEKAAELIRACRPPG